MPTKETRCARAGRALKAYTAQGGGPRYAEEDAETRLTDLVSDLRHLADKLGVEWESVARMSEAHHWAETEGGE